MAGVNAIRTGANQFWYIVGVKGFNDLISNRYVFALWCGHNNWIILLSIMAFCHCLQCVHRFFFDPGHHTESEGWWGEAEIPTFFRLCIIVEYDVEWKCSWLSNNWSNCACISSLRCLAWVRSVEWFHSWIPRNQISSTACGPPSSSMLGKSFP